MTQADAGTCAHGRRQTCLPGIGLGDSLGWCHSTRNRGRGVGIAGVPVKGSSDRLCAGRAFRLRSAVALAIANGASPLPKGYAQRPAHGTQRWRYSSTQETRPAQQPEGAAHALLRQSTPSQAGGADQLAKIVGVHTVELGASVSPPGRDGRVRRARRVGHRGIGGATRAKGIVRRVGRAWVHTASRRTQKATALAHHLCCHTGARNLERRRPGLQREP